ncbi:MAG: hypothetical protein Kow0092_10090 [Deferrisomatales bacterium]
MIPIRQGCAALAAGLLLAVAPAAAAFKQVEVGDPAPSFTLRTLEGRAVSSKDLRGGQVLAVVFWATWSPRSGPMLDDLEQLFQARKDRGFRVVAVNVDHEVLAPEEREAVARWAERWSFPVVLDEGLEMYYTYGVVATPSLALVDAGGTVRYVRASYSSAAREDIREAVDGLLGIEAGPDRTGAVAKREYVPPKKATLHYQKGLLLLRRGRVRRAVRDLEKAASLDPKWAEPRVALARLYRESAGDRPELLAKAEALLREARALRPDHMLTLAELAEVLVEAGKPAEAVDSADRALELEPAYTPALLAKAKGLRALGRLEEAEAAVEAAADASPRDPRVLLEQGELAAARRSWREAAAALRQAVELALAAKGREG